MERALHVPGTIALLLNWLGAMLSGSASIRWVAGLSLAMGVQCGSAAEPMNEQIGGQSRAAIRITVSVMPSFNVTSSNTALTVRRSGNLEALELLSNVAGMRYDLISVPGVPEKGDTLTAEPNVAEHDALLKHSDEPRLLLVVPD